MHSKPGVTGLKHASWNRMLPAPWFPLWPPCLPRQPGLLAAATATPPQGAGLDAANLEHPSFLCQASSRVLESRCEAGPGEGLARAALCQRARGRVCSSNIEGDATTLICTFMAPGFQGRDTEASSPEQVLARCSQGQSEQGRGAGVEPWDGLVGQAGLSWDYCSQQCPLGPVPPATD